MRRFAHRLALQLSCHDVDGLLDSLTPAQFAEWRAFDAIEPIGEHRADWRNAQLICAVGRFLAAMWGESIDLDERKFMPFVFPADESIDEDDPELIFARLDAIAIRFNQGR